MRPSPVKPFFGEFLLSHLDQFLNPAPVWKRTEIAQILDTGIFDGRGFFLPLPHPGAGNGLF